MPTQHKRVSVTLTPPLQEARERLRRRGLDPSVGELAIAGSVASLADVDAGEDESSKRTMLRNRLAERLRSGVGVEQDELLAEVRRDGWTRARERGSEPARHLRLVASARRPHRRRAGAGACRTHRTRRAGNVRAADPGDALQRPRGRDFAMLAEELDALPLLTLDSAAVQRALDAQAQLAEDRRVSHRVKPIDLLVAGVADRHGAAVLHYDSDYELIAEHTDLSFESVWAFKRGSAGSPLRV